LANIRQTYRALYVKV